MRTTLELGATLSMIVASGVLIWAVVTAPKRAPAPPPAPPVGRPKPLPPTPITLNGLSFAGDPSARVAVIEFSDYECQFCARFHQTTLGAIQDSYIRPGKVRFGVRLLPLPRHPLALRAAEAAECAAQAGKFWDMHGLLFAAPRAIDDESIMQKADAIGLDKTAFASCLSAGARSRIDEDMRQARELEITGTPTFLIGIVESDGRLRVLRRESGAIPAPVFVRLLDDVLKKADQH